ncbi:MAG: ankyrin repeat domain-containing protein, partial [Firmicutes bacterium]|nr:ankyrin repeat domain-containing protein [Bacillota bacterium]
MKISKKILSILLSSIFILSSSIESGADFKKNSDTKKFYKKKTELLEYLKKLSDNFVTSMSPYFKELLNNVKKNPKKIIGLLLTTASCGGLLFYSKKKIEDRKSFAHFIKDYDTLKKLKSKSKIEFAKKFQSKVKTFYLPKFLEISDKELKNKVSTTKYILMNIFYILDEFIRNPHSWENFEKNLHLQIIVFNNLFENLNGYNGYEIVLNPNEYDQYLEALPYGEQPSIDLLIRAIKDGYQIILNPNEYDQYLKALTYGEQLLIDLLIRAIKEGNLESAAKLLDDERIDISSLDEDNREALDLALVMCPREVAKQNDFNEIPVVLAIKDNNERLAEWLLTWSLTHGEEIDVNLQNVNGDTLLTLATKKGYIEVVRKLLTNEKINVNSRNDFKETALILAIKEDLEEISKMLLTHGKINVNSQDRIGHTPLMLALKKRMKIASELILHEDTNFDLRSCHGETIPMLILRKYPKDNATDIVIKLLESGYIDVNLQDIGGHTLLMFAAIECYEKLLTKLLENQKININVQNYNGETVLMLVLKRLGKELAEDIAIKLLENKNIDVNLQNIYNKTALMYAAEEGYEKTVEVLLKNENIDVNSQSGDKMTALMLAVQYGHKKITEALLNKEGINLDLKDLVWNTAFMLALKKCPEEVAEDIAIELLKNKDTDVNWQNYYGETALMLASQKGYMRILNELLN